MITDYIYVLIDTSIDQYFYVGRSEDPKRRLQEHQYGARTYEEGDELKYFYASTLDSLGIPWEMKIVMECGPDTKHFEDYFVNKYRLEGHPLQNMKAGDDGPWMGRHYKSPEEFVEARKRSLQKPKVSRPIKAVRRNIDVDRTRFIDEVNKKSVSSGLQAIIDRRNKK